MQQIVFPKRATKKDKEQRRSANCCLIENTIYFCHNAVLLHDPVKQVKQTMRCQTASYTSPVYTTISLFNGFTGDGSTNCKRGAKKTEDQKDRCPDGEDPTDQCSVLKAYKASSTQHVPWREGENPCWERFNKRSSTMVTSRNPEYHLPRKGTANK